MKSAEVESLNNWTIDQHHSKVRFSVRHMVISEVDGQFKDFDFKLKNANEDFTVGEVEIKIKTSSVDTGNSDRDNHLKSADFFDSEKYQEMTFTSSSMEKVNDEKYKLKGDLTIKDTTKPIELDVTYGGTINDPWGNERAGFKVQGTINRFDYGLRWNNLMETGGAVVGKNINITCDIEIIKQTEE